MFLLDTTSAYVFSSWPSRCTASAWRAGMRTPPRAFVNCRIASSAPLRVLPICDCCCSRNSRVVFESSTLNDRVRDTRTSM
jgi:hypothetical protein